MNAARVFWGTLLLLLFVGDGKKSIVDVVGMAGILALGATMLLTKKIRFPSVGIIFWWAALLFYLLIRLPFSDSVAYSLYATVRYFIGFVVFVLFANNLISVRSFSRVVIGFTLVALALSAIVFFVPSMRTWMPEMSLLSNAYAHHHVAYLLVFAMPFTVRGFLLKKTWVSSIPFLIFIVSLVLTRARGAWFVAGLYVLFLVLREKISAKALRVAGVGISALFLILFTVTTIAPQILKKSNFSSARLGYWEQGARAFSDQPVFGSGLGTFYLQSLRYQKKPQSYSWLAHSFPIQMAVETGAIGVMWVTGMIWVIGKQIKRRYDGEMKSIVEAIVFTALYSVFEINLDYLILWILLWSGVGILFSPSSAKPLAFSRWLFYGAFFLVGLFYVANVGAEAAQLASGNRLFLQPYNTQRTLAFLDSRGGGPPLSQKQLDTILWFHRKNPEVISALAETVQETDQPLAIRYYNKALLLDPKSSIRFDGNAKMLKKINEETFQERFEDLSRLFYDQLILTHPELANDSLASEGGTMLFAKAYYIWGMSSRDMHPMLANEALALAARLAQWWSFFYLELASYLVYEENDLSGAREVLRSCLEQMYARDHCIDFSPETLPPPGTFRKEILAIP